VKNFRLSYLPPLMVYVAYGVQGLTGIVGTFFVKDYLDLSAAFLAALAFWAGIPWAMKMPVGHIVDLIWRWKSLLVWLGAAMLAASILIMLGLIRHMEAMRAVMSPENWFVLAALLTPTGYMIQDAVADAMTVEAVPRFDEQGRPITEEARKEMHTTMQTLGRVAVIGGLALVALANVYLFHGTDALPKEEKLKLYDTVYTAALVIPVLSVLGVILHRFLAQPRETPEKTAPNWWVLGGSLVFVLVTLIIGIGNVRHGQEIIFAASFAIILFLLWRLARELEPAARETLVATALIVFIYRAMPSVGPGYTWWSIDILKFDEAFQSKLALVAYGLTLVGMFALRPYMARTSIPGIITMLTIVGTVLTLPNIGMYYGLHEWTARHTGGLVDARVIALIDTVLESPLGQIAMIPMLAWIANCAPNNLKATYFAVMASFSNLALSAAQLGTKYMNQVFTVSREVRDRASGTVKVPQDYSELGVLLIAVTVIGFALPLAVVYAVKALKLKTA
jgi:MFS family permease